MTIAIGWDELKAEYDMKGMQIEECDHPPDSLRLQRITLSEIYIILHIIRKPDSITVKLFI